MIITTNEPWRATLAHRADDTLDAMKADGLVRHEKSNATRGRYSLTDRARDELEDHHEWASRCLDDSSGQQTFYV